MFSGSVEPMSTRFYAPQPSYSDNFQLVFCSFHFVHTDPVSGLLNIHLQLGSLILTDIMPDTTTVMVDGGVFDLRNGRLCACRNVVNAVKLALHSEAFHSGLGSNPCILLSDPHPEQMIHVLSRTGSCLLELFKTGTLKQEIFKPMFLVILTALDIVSELSYLAEQACQQLKQFVKDLGIEAITTCRKDTFGCEAFAAHALDHKLFEKDIIVELEKQTDNSVSIKNTVEQSEKDIFTPSLLDAWIRPIEWDFLSQDWSYNVRLTE